jgi:uncharacterized membrane protein YidH (DUF202 family)
MFDYVFWVYFLFKSVLMRIKDENNFCILKNVLCFGLLVNVFDLRTRERKKKKKKKKKEKNHINIIFIVRIIIVIWDNFTLSP